MAERVRREIAGGREQELMIVVIANDRADRDQAVAAGAVLDDDAHAPFARQAVGGEACANVGAGAGRGGPAAFLL